jgi:arylsulfatase
MIEFYPEVVEELNKIAQQARADLGDELTGHEGSNRRPAGSRKKAVGSRQ